MPAVTSGVPQTSQSVIDLIGNTPLIRLSSFERGLRNVELYAKAEWQKPRRLGEGPAAARMILDGERSGKLTRDKIILDATSGNTGIAYAMIGAARGYRVRLCVPENVTPERKRILACVRRRHRVHRSDGGVRRCDPPGEGDVCGRAGRVLLPGSVQQPRQLAAHYDTTAPEIIEQTDGRVTHFVAGLGTSGTFIGAGGGCARSTRRSA